MGFLESEVFAHHFVGIAIAVSLVVGLVHHVDAPTVAQLVEIFAVGIVRSAQEIDVGLLHQTDILLVGGIIHITASLGMVIVAVHPPQLHVLAVDLEHLANDFNLLHAEVIIEMFDSVALIVFQFQTEGIKVGLFGRP